MFLHCPGMDPLRCFVLRADWSLKFSQFQNNDLRHINVDNSLVPKVNDILSLNLLYIIWALFSILHLTSQNRNKQLLNIKLRKFRLPLKSDIKVNFSLQNYSCVAILSTQLSSYCNHLYLTTTFSRIHISLACISMPCKNTEN